MEEKYITIKFMPSGKKIRKPAGVNLLDAAIDAGIDVDAVCGGKGSCGKCKARVIEGVLNDVTHAEKEHISSEEFDKGYILLCQKNAYDDVVMENVSGESSRGFEISKGFLEDQEFEIEPVIKKYYHELSPPSMHDNTADLDRILNCFSGNLEIEVNIINSLPDLMRKADYHVTSVVYKNKLIGVEKGDTTGELYGIAVDIGTTSIAGYLLDMNEGKIITSNSATNRQKKYGADVISRISYALEKPEGLLELKSQVVKTIDEVIFKLINDSGISREKVYIVTLLGNTVMSHLLLGVSPVGLPSSPFAPAFTKCLRGTARDLGISNLSGHTNFSLLPNISGYVGSDTVGVIIASGMHELPGNWLAIDVGTNGEIILSSDGKLYTCSTAAGPAFEGGNITQGMRAEPGAICKVKINEDINFKVVGDEEPVGICGSGLIDVISEMVRVGILRNNGRIVPPAQCPGDLAEAVKDRIVPTEKGYKFVLYKGNNEVALTQKDISELMLSKGAVRAGIDVLMSELSMKVSDLDGIFLAGAFGSNIEPESIKGIGMIPAIETERIRSIGNAAGRGAIITLLSGRYMELVNNLPEKVNHIELMLHNDFKRRFARAIRFSR